MILLRLFLELWDKNIFYRKSWFLPIMVKKIRDLELVEQ